MTTPRTAAMVVIGNEILSGKIADSNSPFLARELRQLGVTLGRITVIPDEVDIIAAVVAESSRDFDVVFTSGGVGPTHDDLTMEGVAKAFGLRVVEHAELRAVIQSYVEDPNPNQYLLKMAHVPEGAELVETGHTVFPAVMVQNVYILPGIPEMFESKIRHLAERFRGRPFYMRQVLVSEPETSIAEHLDATLSAFPELMLGSYPKLSNPDYKVRLTLESKDETYLERALEDLVARMPKGFIIKIER